MYDVKPANINVPTVAVSYDMQISQTATSLAVVFELLVIKIGLYCVHTSLVFSEAFKEPNLVFR